MGDFAGSGDKSRDRETAILLSAALIEHTDTDFSWQFLRHIVLHATAGVLSILIRRCDKNHAWQYQYNYQHGKRGITPDLTDDPRNPAILLAYLAVRDYKYFMGMIDFEKYGNMLFFSQGVILGTNGGNCIPWNKVMSSNYQVRSHEEFCAWLPNIASLVDSNLFPRSFE